MSIRQRMITLLRTIVWGVNTISGEPEYVGTDGNHRLQVAAILNGSYGWAGDTKFTTTFAVDQVTPNVNWSSWIDSTNAPYTIWFSPTVCTLESFAFEYDYDGLAGQTFGLGPVAFTGPLGPSTTHIFPYVGCQPAEVDRPDTMQPRQPLRSLRWRVGFSRTAGSPDGTVNVKVIGSQIT